MAAAGATRLCSTGRSACLRLRRTTMRWAPPAGVSNRAGVLFLPNHPDVCRSRAVACTVAPSGRVRKAWCRGVHRSGEGTQGFAPRSPACSDDGRSRLSSQTPTIRWDWIGPSLGRVAPGQHDCWVNLDLRPQVLVFFAAPFPDGHPAARTAVLSRALGGRPETV
jgi:hypothetical protein